MASMVARDADYCPHYGRSGKGKDQERRAIKRGKKGDWKKQARKNQL